MAVIFRHIKTIAFNFQGIFVKDHDYLVDDEIRVLNSTVFSDFEMIHPSQDKQNLHGDVNRVITGVKKSILKYKDQH